MFPYLSLTPVRCKHLFRKNANIMNRSNLLYNVIAIVILALVLFMFWNFAASTSYVEGKITSGGVVIDTLSTIYGYLYGMIPICCVLILFSLAVAFYLEEWLSHRSWQYRIIERIIAIFACIPSLVYGLFCVYFIVVKSQQLSYLTLTIAVFFLVVPVTIQTTQKVIQGVDISVREAAYALGANRMRVIRDHVIPNTIPTILVGIFTAISRVLAIAALFIVICGWKITESNSIHSFDIPNNVIVLLLSALLFSVISCLFEKKKSF